MTSHQDLFEEDQRFRSESEPIMSAFKNSTTSLNSSLSSDRDSVISTSSISSEANLYKDGTITKGLIITRTSSTRSAPSDTLMRGIQAHDSDGYYEGEDPEEGAPEEERDEEADEADDEFHEDSLERNSFGPHSGIVRKSAIRRVHTVTPKASSKVKSRRPRAISRDIEDSSKFIQQAGNCETFTVTVDLPACKEMVLYPAKRGVLLSEAIKEISEQRNFEAGTVNVFVESSFSPTPLDCDCSLFAERQLFVRAKPIRPGLLGNDRTRSVSTSVVPHIHVDNGMPDILPRAGGRKDLSKFLGVESDQQAKARRPSLPTISAPPIKTLPTKTKDKVPPMDPKLKILQDKLDHYTVDGLPDFPSLIFAYPQREDDAELLKLEENWRLVVDNHTELPKKTIDQQEAIWEIVNTEVGYIKNIRVIIDIYMTCLIDLQAAGILNSITTEKIFSNIIDIENKHSKFWKEKLTNVMKVARETREPLSALEVAMAFEGFGDHFQAYMTYCTDMESCMEFLREKEKEDEQLKMFLQWGQDYPASRRLKLGDLLVYPMQRITKFPLLLRAVGKKTENEAQKQAVFREMANVEEFIGRVNQEVRREQETKKMSKMIQRIELYDWPEIPPGGAGTDEVRKLIDESPIMIDLQFPMKGACPSQPRWVVHEGPVKIRDQYSSNRFDATIVIFTDMMTICKKGKTKDNSLRIVRPPIRIDRVKTTELKDNSGFVMLCSDEQNCASNWYIVTTNAVSQWLDKINKAHEMYENACSNRNMDKFLDMSHTSNTGLDNLQLPDFLKQRSPRVSPANSPRMPQKFSPSASLMKTNSASSLSRLREEDADACKEDATSKDESIQDDESFEKGSSDNGESSMEDSPDADEEPEESDEEQTPTLARPTVFPNDRRESLKNGGDLPRKDTLTPDDAADGMFSLNPFPSPTSPSPTSAALSIMAFDEDLDDDENPSNPTPFHMGISADNSSAPKRTKATTFKTISGTLSKAMSRGGERSRKPIPNGVAKTQMQELGATSSGEESGGDPDNKQSKNKKSKGGLFSRKGKPKS